MGVWGKDCASLSVQDPTEATSSQRGGLCDVPEYMVTHTPRFPQQMSSLKQPSSGLCVCVCDQAEASIWVSGWSTEYRERGSLSYQKLHLAFSLVTHPKGLLGGTLLQSLCLVYRPNSHFFLAEIYLIQVAFFETNYKHKIK